MRISAVYDNQGNILAATVADEQADQFTVQEGEQLSEFDVPEKLAAGDLRDIVEKLRVELRSMKLIEP